MFNQVPRLRGVLLLGLIALVGCPPLMGQELPPDVLADRYSVEAERQSRDGDHRSALATLDKILGLEAEAGLEIPDIFWVRHARVALAAGFPQRAVESAGKYLELVGQAGSEYLPALELLMNAEEEVARMATEEAARQAREQEAERRAEAERREAERRAEAERREAERRAEAERREAERRAEAERREEARRAEEAIQRAALAREAAARKAVESARERISEGHRGVVVGTLWSSAGGALYYYAEDVTDWWAEEDLEDPDDRDKHVLYVKAVAGIAGVVGIAKLVSGISNWEKGARALREAESRLGDASMGTALSIGRDGEIGLVFAWQF